MKVWINEMAISNNSTYNVKYKPVEIPAEDLAPTPVQPKPAPPVTTYNYDKQEEAALRADLIRYRTERAAAQKQPTQEQIAQTKANEVRNAYVTNKQPNCSAVVNKQPDSALPLVSATEPSNTTVRLDEYATLNLDCRPGYEAASIKLAEVTANQPPEVVALIVEYSQPTINLIGSDLGAISLQYEEEQFNSVIDNLALVSQRASVTPKGNEAVKIISTAISNNINPDSDGRFNNALGGAVEKGTPELTAGVVNQLLATGRVDEANGVMKSVETAINNLQDTIEESTESVAIHSEDLGVLVSQWQPLMTEEQLSAAINNYKSAHPEYTEAINEMDASVISSLRALETFQNTEQRFPGSTYSNDVADALNDLFDENEIKLALMQSQSLPAEMDRLVEKAAIIDSSYNVFTAALDIAGSVDDGQYLTETLFTEYFDHTIDNIINKFASKDFKKNRTNYENELSSQLARLKWTANKFGYGSPELNQVFTHYDRLFRITGNQVKTELKELELSIKVLDKSDTDLFEKNNRFYSRFETMGNLLGGIGMVSSISETVQDPDPINLLGIGVDLLDEGVGYLQDKNPLSDYLKSKSLHNKAFLKTSGKVLGGIGFLLDVWSVREDIIKGKYVDAGFTATGAVGGAMMTFGTAAAVTGIGVVLVGVAIIGQLLWDSHQNSERYEKGATAFLRGAGFDQATANRLMNFPAQVFGTLAEKLGVEPKDYLNYLKSLPADRLASLSKIAGSINPTSDGTYPENVEDLTRITPYEVTVVSPPNDFNDLIQWMQQNGFTDAPGMTASRYQTPGGTAAPSVPTFTTPTAIPAATPTVSVQPVSVTPVPTPVPTPTPNNFQNRGK